MLFRVSHIPWIIAMIAASLSQCVSAQSLDLLRSEVREGPRTGVAGAPQVEPSDSSDSSPRVNEGRYSPSSSLAEDPDQDEWTRALFRPVFHIAIVGVTSPFWGPPAVLGDNYSQHGAFPGHPYALDREGYMVVPVDEEEELKPWGARLRGEYADDFDNLSRMGVQLQADTGTRFGFDTESNYRLESLGNDCHDELWTGDLNALFRFGQGTHATFHAGIGMNWLSDRVGTDLGFNFTYKADLFPRKPWIASAELDLGTLGSEFYWHARATGGIAWHGIESYVGYDWMDVGRFHSGGWIAGIRFWF